MSVLIKGMDMPKSCGECHFLSYPFNVPVCSVTRQIPTYPFSETLEEALSKRMNGCPLVEITEDEENWLDAMNTFYCDRNICASNEVNGISCDECEIAKYHNLEDDDNLCQNCEVGE